MLSFGLPATTTPTPTPTPTATPTPTPTATSISPTYIYLAEMRSCDDCGSNVGQIVVGSYTTLTINSYAIQIGSPAPQTTVYKILAGSSGFAAITVVPTGSNNCTVACNYEVIT